MRLFMSSGHATRWIYSKGSRVSEGMKTLLCLFAFLLVGCASRPLITPVPVVSVVSSELPAEEKVLVVLLPGARSVAGDFVKYGFGEAAAEALGGRADVVAVDLHRGYYEANSAAKLLHYEVIAPAKRRGYREVWLAGVSLGGFGSVMYDLRYPGTLDRLILMAAFLGEEEPVAEVKTSGLTAWEPGEIAREDFSRRFWKGVKEAKGLEAGRVFVGYGDSDRFAGDNAFFASTLGLDARVVPGGHTWKPWKKLWPLLLRDAAAAANF